MKSLKKILGVVIIGILAISALTGCGNKKETKDITIGVCAGPYGEMVKQAISPILEEKGYKVKVTEFSDYVLPDKALANGEIDANLMQHTVYLEKFASDNKLDIKKVISVPTAGAGIFSNSIKSLKDLKNGDTVGIPNDPSNLARALGILAKENVITLKSGIDDTKATENDIASNPKNLKFKTLDAAQISRNLDSLAIGVIPGNYAYAANLDFGDALAVETLAEGYKNVIAVKGDDIDSQLGKDLKSAVESKEFYEAITKKDSKFKDFQKPEWWIEKYGK
ncbi:metal ABC transporter substrate-binding protein [Anaerostipes sp. 494a]|uniref:MetQ/NlpA family ABC transporter substrate-binding protein n=1 Tax=Anaerostipes TaxID=207244 RepID=UPI00095252AB|nr:MULTISPECIES: MetQ/NlpA family ABC transporter substrate-binding protein [Anaerostipes]MDY2726539.1 MetQ/NlpA family ABC transporter substrate-binding protein [Anaerostipes faecalis]OLR60223.1 metal ABC transporter substrate-binding protein [Anaerostipes sp. 494a]